jgi:CHAD domain-containing protein
MYALLFGDIIYSLQSQLILRLKDSAMRSLDFKDESIPFNSESQATVSRPDDAVLPIHPYVHEKINALGKRIIGKAARIDGKNGEEALHDMRVSTRRLRETLQLFAPLFPSRQLKKILGKIKKLTRVLGLPREMDVNLSTLTSVLFPEDSEILIRLTREHLLEILEGERRKRRRKMRKSLAKINLTLLHKQLRSLATAGRKGAWPRLSNSEQAKETSLPDPHFTFLLMDRGRPFQELDSEKIDSLDEQALHLLRIQIKKFRYAMEIVTPWFGNCLNPLIQQARSMQNLLGEYHDLGVLIRYLAECQKQMRDRSRPLFAAGLEEIAHELKKNQDRLRKPFSIHYKDFSNILSRNPVFTAPGERSSEEPTSSNKTAAQIGEA